MATLNFNGVLPPPTGQAKIAIGLYHSCAITPSGGVKCWGDNDYGQLGNGTTTDSKTPVDVLHLDGSAISIAASGEYTCVLTSQRGVKCWGKNWNGQLGDGTRTSRSAPVDVVGLTSGVASISLNSFSNCALMRNGGVKCWGVPANGLTPYDVTNLPDKIKTISTGASHACLLTFSGGVKCWGTSDYVGDGSSGGYKSDPVDVAGLSTGVVSIDAGSQYTCAVLEDGGLKCWGKNFFGELGDGTTTSRLTPVGVHDLPGAVKSVSAGIAHTCAVMRNGNALCWGDNAHGQLGDGTTDQQLTPVEVFEQYGGAAQIDSSGYMHTCARYSDDVLRCWGWNLYGQLGDGTTVSRKYPVVVTD